MKLRMWYEYFLKLKSMFCFVFSSLVKSLPTFTERIRKFQILNQQIFACLNKYLCHTTTDEIPSEQIKCLTPMTLQTIQFV